MAHTHTDTQERKHMSADSFDSLENIFASFDRFVESRPYLQDQPEPKSPARMKAPMHKHNALKPSHQGHIITAVIDSWVSQA